MGPHETTLAYLTLLSLGFIISAYGTIVGAAGGFLYVPLLLLLYPHDHHSTLTAIALAVNFITSMSGTSAYARQKRIDYKSGILFAVATIPGAILGVMATNAIPRIYFEGIFSFFLIGLSLFLFLRPKSDTAAAGEKVSPAGRGVLRILKEVNGITFDYHYNLPLGLLSFFFLGFVSSFLGIGGGSLIMPTLAYLLSFPVFIATATSMFTVSVITFTASIAHIFQGSFHHGAHRIAAMGIGALTGSQFGALVSKKVKGPWVIRGLALAVAVVGVRMLMLVI
jgi:uncharacterized protein